MRTTLEGLVLCWVGADRFAVLAAGVGHIVEVGAEVVWAGAAFEAGATRPESTRGLAQGPSVVAVDRLDVYAQACLLLRVPPACGNGAGLSGFVEVRGELWPLLSLDGLFEHLSGAT